jgi:hypothetical protein
MKYSWYVLFALALLCLPATCQAESTCPWINQATSLGILGTSEGSPMAGPTTVSDTACSFTYRSDSGVRELRVTVEQVQDPEQAFNTYKMRCGSGASPLQAIGNEALLCAPDKKGHSQEVVGRVRDNIFTITLSTTIEKDSFMPKDALAEKVRLAAEQVSGNLF